MSPHGFITMFFGHAFRPLFVLATLQALVMLGLWALWWAGLLPLQLPGIPMYWHAHELLNGLVAAAIGGFLLTAVATWTQRPPLQGWPLMLLALAWLGGRLSLLSAPLAAVCDVLYWAVLLLLMGNEVLRAGNRRNYKVLLVLALFLALDLAFHLAPVLLPGQERRLVWAQLWLVIILINLIGGRIIPAFTRNWLLRRDPAAATPAAFDKLDITASGLLVLFAVSTLLPLPAWWLLGTGMLTAVLQAWRLSRWQGLHTGSDALVWMLHLAYAWIPLGCLLLAFSHAGWLPASAGLHALTIGAIATMIMAVSSRAALGHTGRPLRSHPMLTIAVLLLTLATSARIMASISGYNGLVHTAAALWLCAFVAYAAANLQVLLSPARTP